MANEFYYEKFLSFLRNHNLYNENILNYWKKNQLPFDYRDEEKRGLMNTFKNLLNKQQSNSALNNVQMQINKMKQEIASKNNLINSLKQKITQFNNDYNKKLLEIKPQVEQLIRQATSHENLCQSYLGWSPFW